jgi:outer membrane lipoprotein carrier protein
MRAIRVLAVTGAVLAAALIAGNAFAGARDDLTKFTKGLKGLDGQFSQQVFDANGKRKESSNGRVAMSAPRLFRWEYVKPYPQLIVADGKNVWVYDPDLQQVTKRAQGAEEQNSPLAAISHWRTGIAAMLMALVLKTQSLR